MALSNHTIINNSDSGASVRTTLNNMRTEGMMFSFEPTVTSEALLKALVTAGVTKPRLIVALTSPATGQANLWYMRAGTDVENAPGGILRPDDYAASTNETIFEKVM